jgi:steroid 5-alpha reductase family enzyme
MGKGRSLGLVGLAYLVALGAAVLWLWLVPSTGRGWLDALLADVVGTLVIFLFSRRFRNSSFYDAYWSVVPVLLLAYWWTHANTRNWLLAAVVVLWAVRLTANWVVTFPGLHHEDWRYPMLRRRAGRFEVVADLLGIHLVPTLQVFLAMVPAYVALATPDEGLAWLAWVAFAVGVAAVALELAADLQLRRFAATRREGQVMDQGLWAWSRHPNYFGEFAFWFAVALFGVAASPADAWWLFAGAAGILAMFLGASIPMMEARSLERRPGYQDVVDRVPRFVPRPPRSVAS